MSVISLFKTLRNVVVGSIVTNGSDDTVKIVRSIVSGMKSTLKLIDKYLSKGKDKALEYYDEASVKLNEYKNKTKEKSGTLIKEVKEKGFLKTVGNKVNDTKSKLAEVFKTDNEKANAPPENATPASDQIKPSVDGQSEENNNKDTGVLNTIITTISSLKSSIDNLTKTNKDSVKYDAAKEGKLEKAEEKKSFLEKATKSFDLQRERFSKRKKEISDEKEAAANKGKKPKSLAGGIFSGIISAIGALGGVFTAGIGGLLKFLPGLLGKAVFGGIKGTLFRLIPFVAKKLAFYFGGALTSLAGTALGGAVSLAGSAIGAVAGGLGSMAMAGLSAVGAAIVSPIGLGVIAVAATLYGGYKLYKYLSRNNLGSGVSGELTKLRMLSYGYNDNNRDHYNKLLDLDMLMAGYVSNKDSRASYKKFDKEFKDKALKIFEVKRDEKEKYKILNEWLIKRYTVAHAAFMNAYYSAGGSAYLDDLDKLTDDQNFDLVTRYNLPTEVHEVVNIPVFENSKSTVTKDQIDVLLTSLRQSVKDKSENLKGKTSEEIQKINETKLKRQQALEKLNTDNLNKEVTQKLEQDKKPDEVKDKTEPLEQKGVLSQKINLYNKPDKQQGVEEAENPPPSTEGKEVSNDKPLQSSIDKVAKAAGPMVTENKSLVGIKSQVATEKIHSLDPNVLKLFSGMAKEYNDLTGKSVLVTEAYRTKADQESLRRSKGDGAAPAGTSLHEFGIAIDINSPDADALDKMGLMRKYGFTRPLSGETWHIEPAGVALSPETSKNDKVDRAKRVLSSPGRGGGGPGAKRGVPRSQMYKRNMALQQKIFDSGETIENLIKPEENKEKASEIKPPILDNTSESQSKPSGGNSLIQSSFESKSQELVKPQTSQSSKAGLDEVKPPSQNAGAQLKPPQMASAVRTGEEIENKPSVSTSSNDAGGSNNPANYANMSAKDAILQASKVVGVDYQTLLAFAQVESSMRTGVKASTSSATGLFQITGGTWKELLNKHGKKYGIPSDASPSNPYYNSVLGAAYAKDNMSVMSKFESSGIRKDTLIYLAHHFGPGGGPRIATAFTKEPESSMQNAVSSNAYKANLQELSGKNVKQYISYLDNKLAKAGSAGASSSAATTKPADDKSKPSSAVSATNGKKDPAFENIGYGKNTTSVDTGVTGQTDGGYKKPEAPTAPPPAVAIPTNSAKPANGYNTDYRDLVNTSGLYKKPEASVNKDEVKSLSTTEIPSDYSIVLGKDKKETNNIPIIPSQKPSYDDEDDEVVEEEPWKKTGETIQQWTKRVVAQDLAEKQNKPPMTSVVNKLQIPKSIVPNVSSEDANRVKREQIITPQVQTPDSEVSYTNTPDQDSSSVKSVPGVVVPSNTPQRGVVVPSLKTEDIKSLGKGMNTYPLQKTIVSDINKTISNTSSTLNNGLSGAVNTLTNGLNKAGSSMAANMPQMPQMPQPSAVLSLDKTESILTSMGDTLGQIKGILQSIHDKGSMTERGDQRARQESPQTQTSGSGSGNSQTPISAPIDKLPSSSGVSMSRRSVLG